MQEQQQLPGLLLCFQQWVSKQRPRSAQGNVPGAGGKRRAGRSRCSRAEGRRGVMRTWVPAKTERARSSVWRGGGQGQREGPALPTPDSVCALAGITCCPIQLLHPVSSPLFPVSNQGTQEASTAPADETWKGNWPRRANGWFLPWLSMVLPQRLHHSSHSDQALARSGRAGHLLPSISTTAPRTTGPCKAPALKSSQI